MTNWTVNWDSNLGLFLVVDTCAFYRQTEQKAVKRSAERWRSAQSWCFTFESPIYCHYQVQSSDMAVLRCLTGTTEASTLSNWACFGLDTWMGNARRICTVIWWNFLWLFLQSRLGHWSNFLTENKNVKWFSVQDCFDVPFDHISALSSAQFFNWLNFFGILLWKYRNIVLMVVWVMMKTVDFHFSFHSL